MLPGAVAVPPAAAAVVQRIEIGTLALAVAGTAALRARAIALQPVDPTGSRWQLASASVSVAGPGWRSGELQLDATLIGAAAELTIEAQASVAGTPVLAVAAVRDTTGTFVRAEVPRLRLGEGGIAAEALVASLPPWLAKPSGTLAAGIVLALTDAPEARAWLELEDGAIELAGIGLLGISTRMSLESLSPPVSLPGQMLRIERIEAGLPVGPLEALYALDPGLLLQVRRTSLGIAQGRLVTRPFVLDLLRPQGFIEAELSGLDLGALVAALSVDGLAASGRLNGEARLSIDPHNGIVFDSLQLSAQDGGILRYRGAALAPAEEPRLALLSQVLEDFHYRRLEAQLQGPLAGELRLRVMLEGANPAVYGGYPVALDLRFDGPLGRILQQGLRSHRLPDVFGEQLRERLR